VCAAESRGRVRGSRGTAEYLVERVPSSAACLAVRLGGEHRRLLTFRLETFWCKILWLGFGGASGVCPSVPQ
tara:strand:+ start:1124 stop:1339 length:216 start_codon:yes stop_codon:yes gene_type:complete